MLATRNIHIIQQKREQLECVAKHARKVLDRGRATTLFSGDPGTHRQRNVGSQCPRGLWDPVVAARKPCLHGSWSIRTLWHWDTLQTNKDEMEQSREHLERSFCQICGTVLRATVACAFRFNVPSSFVGLYRQSILNMTDTGVYDTQHNANPMYLARIKHKWRATSGAADDRNRNVGPYKIGKYALATMDALMRNLAVRAHGPLTDDVVENTRCAFDPASRLDYWMYTTQFAITQGKMEPVWNYGETPGGQIWTVMAAMPEITAVPGVHLSRVPPSITSTNPELYIPAETLPGDPKCWWGKNCRFGPCSHITLS
jgi:hypothetical protein